MLWPKARLTYSSLKSVTKNRSACQNIASIDATGSSSWGKLIAFSTQQRNRTSFNNDTMFQWNVTPFHSAQRYARFPLQTTSLRISVRGSDHSKSTSHSSELSLKKKKELLPVASILRAMATQRNSPCRERFEVPEKCCTSVEHPLQSQVLGK